MSITDEQKFFELTEALEAAAIAEDSSSTEYGCSDRGESLAKLPECRLALLQYFREREFSTYSNSTGSPRDLEVMTFTIDENKLAEIAGKSHSESSPEDWAGLILAVSERDSCIADLEQAVADSAVEIGRLQEQVADLKDKIFCEVEPKGETHDMSAGMICVKCWNRVCDAKHALTDQLAELRKPVAVEISGLLSVLRAVWADGIKEAKDHPERFPAGHSTVVIAYLFDQVDALAQNAAAMRNAHDVLMAEMRGLRERLDTALIESVNAKYALSTGLAAAEERERQLREALKLARKYAHCDRECSGSSYQNGQRVSCGCGFAKALPKIIAVDTNTVVSTDESGRRVYKQRTDDL